MTFLDHGSASSILSQLRSWTKQTKPLATAQFPKPGNKNKSIMLPATMVGRQSILHLNPGRSTHGFDRYREGHGADSGQAAWLV
jgi:hypothetical protein